MNDLLKTTWEEFENEFEEGWTDNADCPTIINLDHHHAVSRAVANELSEKFDSYEDFMICDNKTCHERLTLAHRLYEKWAGILFPYDRIWMGNECESPEFLEAMRESHKVK